MDNELKLVKMAAALKIMVEVKKEMFPHYKEQGGGFDWKAGYADGLAHAATDLITDLERILKEVGIDE